jgi:cytochrome c
MDASTRLVTACLFALFGAAAFFVAAPARGDATADRALEGAIREGKALYEKSWRRGAKSCRACHTRGPNKMTAERLKSYPKYNKDLRKVVSAQQMLQHMIKKKGGGTPPELGSAELNALEAYVSTLR